MALSPAPRRLAAGIARALALVTVASAVAACGEAARSRDAGTTAACPVGAAPPDLSTPSAALGAAARALAAGDLAALDACLTEAAAAGVRRDLLAWKAVLVDPAGGPRALARIPSPVDDAEKAAYRAGFEGDPAGLLRMLARASQAAEGGGAGAAPRVEAPAPGATERVTGDRVLPDGTRRRAVLVRRGGAWRVDRLAL